MEIHKTLVNQGDACVSPKQNKVVTLFSQSGSSQFTALSRTFNRLQVLSSSSDIGLLYGGNNTFVNHNLQD